MKFEVQRQKHPNESGYEKDDLNLAYDFTKRIWREFGDFIKAVVLFGSKARKEGSKKTDIDILIIVDDTQIKISAEIAEAYRLITQKLIMEVSNRIHVTTLRFTSFWDYVRQGDPIGINMLRDGVPLIDRGFFTPMQILLFQGRIKPTYEAIWTYFGRAPRTLYNSRWHLMQATLDLYWAVIDSAQAALMKLDHMPPPPEHVAAAMTEYMVNKKILEKKYPLIMQKFYVLSKKILHREIQEIRGDEYERYYAEARDFVDRMKHLIEHGK